MRQTARQKEIEEGLAVGMNEKALTIASAMKAARQAMNLYIPDNWPDFIRNRSVVKRAV